MEDNAGDAGKKENKVRNPGFQKDQIEIKITTMQVVQFRFYRSDLGRRLLGYRLDI